MTPRLTLTGEVNTLTGYGQHLYQVARYLNRSGIYVSVRATTKSEVFGANIPHEIRPHLVSNRQPEPWELMICPPHHPPTPGRKTAYFTMWESTWLPGHSMEHLNRADAVIVPCEWNRQCFIGSGVERPIFVVPLGFDPAVFFQRPPLTTGPTIFTAAGRTAHGRDRKGMDGVIRAFRTAFPYDKNVRLKIKCHPDCGLPEINDSRIEVTRQHLTEIQLADWLAHSHCFASAATGEGWGLWQLQSMAVGRPVIAAIYGGLKEFMADWSSYPVAYREGPCSENWSGKWALPDLESMIEQMRTVHANRDEAIHKGEVSAVLAKQFTWEKAGDKLVDVLRIIGVIPKITTKHTLSIKTKSVIEQCENNNWKVERLGFQLNPNEVVFNPSVVELNGERIWFHRSSIRNSDNNQVSSQIFACREESYVPLSHRIPIKLPGLETDYFEDPRATVHNGEIILSYTRVPKGRNALQEVAFLGGDLKPRTMWGVRFGQNYLKPEKNWVWFSHDGAMHFIYWMEPMRVCRVEDGGVVKVYDSDKRSPFWAHGIKHGGTPPTRIGDEYFGFFHSLTPWFGRDRSRYYVHAYAFAAKPPFQITKISERPLLASDDDLRNNPCSCVISGGAVLNDGIWTLAVGARDEQSLRVQIPHSQIMDTMRDTQ